MVDYDSYDAYRKVWRGTHRRQKTYFKDYHLTNNIFKDTGDYYTFTIRKDDDPLWVFKFDNDKKAKFDLKNPQKFIWNPVLESVQKTYAHVYISNFKEKECKLFVLNFSNLTKLKNSMESINFNKIGLYELFCDLTGLKRSCFPPLDNISNDNHAPNPYTYVCKPLQKVRLIDPDITTYPFDIPGDFAAVLYKCISDLNMHFDGYIFDPLLIDVTEDITDYYLNGWTSKIVLFNPSDFINDESKVVLNTASIKSPKDETFTGYYIIEKEIKRSLKEYENTIVFKILYEDIFKFCKKFNLKGDKEVACKKFNLSYAF